MRKASSILFCALLQFFFILSHAQSNFNYVPNPSFEADSMAPPITAFNWNRFTDWNRDSLYSQPGNALYLSKYWFQPTGGTPDFLNSQKSNLLGFKTKTARTGSGRMGIITGIAQHGLVTSLLYKDTYAEYIECRLLHPLDSGKIYCVRYYVALDRKSNFCSHGFGFSVSRDSVRDPSSHSVIWSYEVKAHINAADDHFITKDEGWVMICDTFVAKGGEDFLTLGAFANEFPKHIHAVKKSQHSKLRVNPFNKFAYYYVDDVSLVAIQPDEQLCDAPKDTITRNNIVLLLDISGSMNEKGYVDSAKTAIAQLLARMSPADLVSIVAFNDHASIIADHIHAGDTAAVRKAFSQMIPGGATNGDEAFKTAYNIMYKNPLRVGNNKIILLTDGEIYLHNDIKKLIRDDGANDNIRFSIVIFGKETPKEISELATASGGHATYLGARNPDEALYSESSKDVFDTPYGTRNAGKIIAWEAVTKVLLPAAVVFLFMKH